MHAFWHSLRAQLFPAWAGVIRVYMCHDTVGVPFPRMGGGDPGGGWMMYCGYGLFPAWAGVILAAKSSII